MTYLCYPVSPISHDGGALAHERFTLEGTFDRQSLDAWLNGRAAMLGLSLDLQQRGGGRQGGRATTSFDLHGPRALLDAFETACLLGPADAWIDCIERVDCRVFEQN